MMSAWGHNYLYLSRALAFSFYCVQWALGFLSLWIITSFLVRAGSVFLVTQRFIAIPAVADNTLAEVSFQHFSVPHLTSNI